MPDVTSRPALVAVAIAAEVRIDAARAGRRAAEVEPALPDLGVPAR
jgi:hypothetical protein